MKNLYTKKISSYSKAILDAFEYLLKKNKDVIVIGQGVWSPWYVGDTMNGLEKKFGKKRVIDTPVSEAAVTGMAIGASIFDTRPIVVHPRMDFMLMATDQIINQAAKWKYILGGAKDVKVTIRSIINRGGEQGAQHSQSLYSLFANIPGIYVLMPSNPQDAFDMLISATYANSPVIFIDDRWLYNLKSKITYSKKYNQDTIKNFKAKVIKKGNDITIVSQSYGSYFSSKVSNILKENNISAEIIDLRIINPLKIDAVYKSVLKTKKLVVIDFGWSNCSVSSEVIAKVNIYLSKRKKFYRSKRFNLPDTPAPTNRVLEDKYYLDEKKVAKSILKDFFRF
tara:strand:- start:5841 stop:6854 length:1014 start_codon:yes stop_codon:yes gene_type:complete